MTSYWCELAWLGGQRVEPGVAIEVEVGRIGKVREGVTSPPEGGVKLSGLTIPGLANTHSHAFQRVLRGRTQVGRGDFWTWRQQMYEAAASLDPDGYFALARATFGEMALAGITAVGEFHYLHHDPSGTPYTDPNAMGLAVIEAARQAGIRITLLDACYLHGGIGEEPAGVQRRFSDGSAEAWAERVDALDQAPTARIGAAIHSLRAVDPGSCGVVASWSGGRPLHAHLSERTAENEACAAAYGSTPAALLAEAGAISESFTAVHATHLGAGDLNLLAAGSVCLCPTTERDLADGIGPARRLADAGARLCLGTDSNALIDTFEEARAVELDERLASGERGHHGAPALIEAATACGYSSLGWPEGGRIEEGAPADLVTVAIDGVRLAGTAPDHALESLVFAAGAPDVRQVIVGGDVVVGDGAHVSIDVPRELEDAIAAVGR